MIRQQKRPFDLLATILSLTIVCVGAIPWGHATPADSPVTSAVTTPTVIQPKHLPTLAVMVGTGGGQKQNGINLEDLLAVEMSNQSILQIVDRAEIQAVLKEYAIALNNVGNPQNAIALGKIVGADLLLHVLLEEKTATIRLIEVASGQVKVEDEVALREDLALSAVAIREKVLAAVRPESQAANRLTVGIAAFPNRSGTDRSDKLGIELQKALRKRLQDRPWAVVLERQYPTALLEEVDLARLGLVRENAVEKLPPADLVILGTLEDVGREYEPGKPWEVKLDLTLRLRGHSHQINEKCRSDTIVSAADRIMATIDKLNRQPTSQTIVSEKELWRRQALYLMPRPMLSGYRSAIIPEFYSSNKTNQREVIRAWENVLLLDDGNAEAMTYLGVCWIGFTRWWYVPVNISGTERNTRVAQWIAASQLLERAIEIQPTKERAATYLYCLRPMVDAVPTRAKEMAQYVQSHPESFAGIPESPWVKVALARSGTTNGNGRYLQLDRVLANAADDPNAVLISFPPGLTKSGPVKQFTTLLNRYVDSPNPVVQFVVHRALGVMLCSAKKDPTSLDHFDKAIAAMEAAYVKCKSPHRDNLNNIYRLKIEACLSFNRPEEAKKTAWAGANHFMEVGRFDSLDHFNSTSSWFYKSDIGWLYQYCVTEALKDGQEKQALDVCDAYLTSAKSAWTLSAPWPRISARREELLARLAGNRPPDMSRLKAVASWENNLMASINRACVSMAALNDILWFPQFSPRVWGGMSRFQHNIIAKAPGAPKDNYRGVAATNDAVFCGGTHGLYKLDGNGNLLKHYSHSNSGLPGRSIGDLCEGDGKIYFSFRGSPRSGIAVLDPITDKITVLAPSNHEATEATEPVDCRGSYVLWDSTSRRLFVQNHFHRMHGSPVLTSVYRWSAKDSTWCRLPLNEAPLFIVSKGDETLLVRTAGGKTEFHFIKSGQKLTASVPVPTLLGRPAWDEHHIWTPTASGLYEIDRASGRMTWIAYEDGNYFRSVLKVAGRLYISTNRGLYYRDISPMPTVTGTPVEKGLVLYCRVNANAKEGIGYGKLVVEEVTEKPPEDVHTVETSVGKK